MPRPKIYEGLTQTSIMVESVILAQARSQGINISDVVRGALLIAINDPKIAKKYDPIEKYMNCLADQTIQTAIDILTIRKDNYKAVIDLFKRSAGLSVKPEDINEIIKRYKEALKCQAKENAPVVDRYI